MKLSYLVEDSIDKMDKLKRKELKKEMKHVKHFVKGVEKGKTDSPRFQKKLNKNIEKELKLVIGLLDRGITTIMGIDLKKLLNGFYNNKGNSFINQFVELDDDAIKNMVEKLGGEKYLDEPEDDDYDDDEDDE